MTPALLLALALTAGTQPVVLLSPEDRSLILGPIIQSVQAQLSDLPVELRVEPVPRLEGSLGAQMRVARQVAGPRGLAVVWLEISPGDPVFVYVADPQHNRVLARSLDWDGALGHLEAVGLIIRASVQALLAGQSIGFEASPVPERSMPGGRPVAPPEPAFFHLGMTLAYSLSALRGDAPVQNGLDAALFAGLGDHLYVTAGYRFFPSFFMTVIPWESGPISNVTIARHPMWLGLGARLEFWRMQVGGELTATLDEVDIQLQRASGWPDIAPPHNQLVWGVAPNLFASVRIVGPLSGFASFGIDVPVSEHRYLVYGSLGQGVVLQPWDVQPRGAFGLRIDLL